MQIEQLSTSEVQKFRNKEQIYLKEDEVLRNVELIRVGEGMSEFGSFFTLDLDDGNSVGTILVSNSTKFGEEMKRAFTTKDKYGRRVLRSHLKGMKIYIGKTEPKEVNKTGKYESKFVWGFEEPHE